VIRRGDHTRHRDLAPTQHGSVALTDDGLGQGGPMRRRSARVPAPRSAFAGFRFPPDVIMVAVRWYLRYGLSTATWKSSSPNTVSPLTT
jgi:hypothetical protein